MQRTQHTWPGMNPNKNRRLKSSSSLLDKIVLKTWVQLSILCHMPCDCANPGEDCVVHCFELVACFCFLIVLNWLPVSSKNRLQKNRHWLQLKVLTSDSYCVHPAQISPHFAHLPQICQNWPQIWPRSPSLRRTTLGCLHTWYKSRLVVKHDMCEHVLF